MKVVNTSTLPKLSTWEMDQVYNGLDCCVTAEILDVLLPQLDKTTAATYDFSRSLQGPVFDMRLRGVKIDMGRRTEVLGEFASKVDRWESALERLVAEGAGFYGFSWRAWQSLHKLFYDIYRIPPIKTKEGKRTADRNALEKLEAYRIARPIVRYMEILRDLDKKMDVLTMELDDDGRIRSSYNIAGTNTGRFSSSFNEFGAGGNLQNIEESLRSIFISDTGMKLANFDAEQGESRIVGAIEWNLFHNAEYLDACESDDVHLTVAHMCGLGPDKRQMCKVLGHGTNYGGKPQTMSNHTHIAIPIIVDFQRKYFQAFPGHQKWHSWVEQQLLSHGRLVSLMGRKRYFFGRRDADDTLREAIAYDPQGSLADIVNQGMLRVWRSGDCQLLMQNHDSILVQYPEEMEDEIIPKVAAQLHNELLLKFGRTLTVPYSCKVGWNWGIHSESNPDGLQSYKPGDQRRRTAEA
jgi:DNA polymerase I